MVQVFVSFYWFLIIMFIYLFILFFILFFLIFLFFLSDFYLFTLKKKNENSIVPFPPTNLQLIQKNSTSVSISWNEDPQSSYYKIVISPPILPQITKYESTSFTFNSLSPSTTYSVTIYSGKNNPIGGNETYETVGMTLPISLLFIIFSNAYENNDLIGTSIQFTTCPTGSYGLNCDRILYFFFIYFFSFLFL